MTDDEEKRLEKCLEIALDNRKLEIGLLWQRTLIFWGFVAALFVAVASVLGKSRGLAAALSIAGVVFSLIWALANRGSKSWQESWELKADDFLIRRYTVDEKIFRRKTQSQNDVFFLLRPLKYSVSKLLVALSDFVVIIWIGLTLRLTVDVYDRYPRHLDKYAIGIFAVFGFMYLLYVLYACRSRPEE